MSKINVSLVARQYVENGWALVPIADGTKGPRTRGWNQRDQCVTTADACTRVKANVGLAHLYSRTCVLDFDDMAKAAAWLRAQGIALADLWNAPDAVRISSGRLNRGKLLFRLPDGVLSLRSYNMQDHGIELRCATADGLTVQDMLPPSIHPDTGHPYEWEYADELIGDWRHPPVLPATVLAAWRAKDTPAERPANEPMGLPRLDAQRLLAQFDPAAPYPEWIEAGMAMHHEFRGGSIGFELWDEWSSRAHNYPGPDALERHWESFRADGRLVTINTLMAKAGVATVDDFEALPDAEPAKAPRFAIQSAGAFSAAASPGWFIKNMLPRIGLAVVYGESGAGKSFALIDMMLAIARGVDWRGLRTKQGRVVYICAEGLGGFRKRLQAYARQFGVDLDALPFGVIGDVPNLLGHDDKAIAIQIAAWGGADVIVVDTLAQSTAGANENAGEDMGKAIAHCKRLGDATGALVVLVHHAGKDLSKGSRGWSGIKAAADVEIEVSRARDDRAIRVSKQKDGEEGQELGFKLVPIIIGVDEDGDDITSCIVEHCAAVPHAERKREPSGPVEKIVYRYLTAMPAKDQGTIEKHELIANVKDLLDAPTDGKRDRRLDNIARAIKALAANNLIDDDGIDVRLL